MACNEAGPVTRGGGRGPNAQGYVTCFEYEEQVFNMKRGFLCLILTYNWRMKKHVICDLGQHLCKKY